MTHTQTTEKVVGTWGLISIYYLFEDGSKKNMYGENPIGILMYDNHGYMNAQLGANQRQHISHSDQVDESTVKSIFYDTYIAYYGTYYEESEGKIIHEVIGCTNPSWIGGREVRFVDVRGDELRIWTPPCMVDGKEAVIEVMWQRVL